MWWRAARAAGTFAAALALLVAAFGLETLVLAAAAAAAALAFPRRGPLALALGLVFARPLLEAPCGGEGGGEGGGDVPLWVLTVPPNAKRAAETTARLRGAGVDRPLLHVARKALPGEDVDIDYARSYAALLDRAAAGGPWLAVVEDDAVPLPWFAAGLRRVTGGGGGVCAAPVVAWLGSANAIDWAVSGRVTTGFVGMLYNRAGAAAVAALLREQYPAALAATPGLSADVYLAQRCNEGALPCTALPLVRSAVTRSSRRPGVYGGVGLGR